MFETPIKHHYYITYYIFFPMLKAWKNVEDGKRKNFKTIGEQLKMSKEKERAADDSQNRPWS